MLIANTLGQEITPQEVAVEFRERGYYPLPVTEPPPVSPPVYDLIPPPVSPPISVPFVPLSPYIPAPLPVSPPDIYIPDLPVMQIQPYPFTPGITIIDMLPISPAPIKLLREEPVPPPISLPGPTLYIPPDSPWVPTSPAIIYDPVIDLAPPREILPGLPVLDLPLFIPELELPEIPQFIIDEFSLPAVSPPVVAEPITPDVEFYEELPEKKRSPWLVLAAAGAVMLVLAQGENKKGKKKRRGSVERDVENFRRGAAFGPQEELI